jgi:hypothetical protein
MKRGLRASLYAIWRIVYLCDNRLQGSPSLGLAELDSGLKPLSGCRFMAQAVCRQSRHDHITQSQIPDDQQMFVEA